MRLLYKPENFAFQKVKQYRRLENFRISLTERNWVGDAYMSKADCSWFVSDLMAADAKLGLGGYLGSFITKTHFDFLVDTSVFAGKNENEKLLAFLAELSSRKSFDSREEKQLKKKLNYFANNLENHIYLYRWCFQEPSHPYSSELLSSLNKAADALGVKGRNALFKMTEKIKQEMDKAGKKTGYADGERLYNQKSAEMIMTLEKNESEIFGKIFKHAFEDALLFYFAVYAMARYYEESNVNASEGNVFCSFERNGKNMEVFLKDSTEDLSDIFLRHEAFLKSFPKQKRNGLGTFRIHKSLYDLPLIRDSGLEKEKLSVLKTIVAWVASRIPEDKTNVLPKKTWIHVVKSDALLNQGMRHMTFESAESVGGMQGAELHLKAYITFNDEPDILFPVFDPESWDRLDSLQCHLMAYAICLYHDICIENNYTLIPLGYADAEYELVTKETSGQTSLHLSKDGSSKTGGAAAADDHRSEHWVSFHFRRLRPRHNVSEEAKEKARKYGIKELPRGFTFVDSFVRGERTQETSDMRISALDVLNRTFKKIDSYDEEMLKAEAK